MICSRFPFEEPSRLGLICGGGQFPMMVARGAKRAGHHVVGVGIKGLADPRLAQLADEFYWTRAPRLGRWIRIFRQHHCHLAILAGAVRKADVYARGTILYHCPDWTTLRLWLRVPNKRSDTLLKAVADELTERGIVVEECTKYTRECMAREGVMTTRHPSPAQEKDLAFGWKVAKTLGQYDVGQSVAVKEQDVIAVEAVEGTDRMIERAGALCKSGGWSLIKVSKPKQDRRFDVPTIGPDTIENLHRHGGRLCCVEAEQTLMVEPATLLALADRYGIVVVGRKDPAR